MEEEDQKEDWHRVRQREVCWKRRIGHYCEVHLLVCCGLEVREQPPNFTKLCLTLSQHLLGTLKLPLIAVGIQTGPQLVNLCQMWWGMINKKNRSGKTISLQVIPTYHSEESVMLWFTKTIPFETSINQTPCTYGCFFCLFFFMP